MVPTPTCVGLVLCEKVVVEDRSHNLTLVNCFHRLLIDDTPYTADPFYLYFRLADGRGDGKLTIKIIEPKNLSVAHEAWMTVQFDDPTESMRFVFPVSGCTFEPAGRHHVTLTVDDELAALAVFVVEVGEE